MRRITWVLPLAALLGMLVPLASAHPLKESRKPIPVTYLQPDWAPAHTGPNVLGKTTNLSILLDYQDFSSVPEMVITLYLPKGVHVLKSVVRWIGYYPTIPGSDKPNFSDSKFTKSKAGRPVWIYKHLTNKFLPAWTFTMNVPAGMKQLCVSATARPVGIKGEVQKATGCVPPAQ